MLACFQLVAVRAFVHVHLHGTAGSGDILPRVQPRLIREERLIARVNVLGELATELRQNVLFIRDKVASGTTARTLAEYERLVLNTNGFND